MQKSDNNYKFLENNKEISYYWHTKGLYHKIMEL